MEKLYYTQPDAYEFSAEITDARIKNSYFELTLSRTAFFPEGGGQLCDLGEIDGVTVLSVYEEDGVVWHVLKSSLHFAVGQSVCGNVSQNVRKDRSCQHTGEHMLSGLASSMFNAKNVGFHMSEEYSTLDLDKELTAVQVAELEYAANRAVFDDKRIWTEQVDLAELDRRTLRKRTEGIEEKSDEFRIVYIDGVDSCTCCGTHCKRTSEVGVIKIISRQKHKEGVRLWFLCSERAYKDYVKTFDTADGIARRFSTSRDKVFSCVTAQGDELSETKRLYHKALDGLMSYKAAELLKDATVTRGIKVVVFADTAETVDINLLSKKITELGERAAALLFSVRGQDISYVLASSEGVFPKMNELSQTVNVLFDGKGGGRPTFCQGRAVFKSVSQLDASVEQLKNYLAAVIGK